MAALAPLDLRAVAELRRLAATGEAKRIRLEARIKLVELAAHLGHPPATLSRWESGDRIPNASEAIRWLQALRELQQP